MPKLNVISEKASKIADKGISKASDVFSIAKSNYKKAAEASKPAIAFAKTVPAKTEILYKKALGEAPSTSTLSKVGFWSGIASLPFGFPANVIAIASGVTVEDRRRILSREGYRTAATLLIAPKAGDLLKSRIGLAAGGVSIAITIVGLIIIAKKRKAEKITEEEVDSAA